MAHFAKVVNGLVTKVIVAEPEFFQNFVDDSPGLWVQTSYNTKGGVHINPETGEPSADQSKALRKNYAGVGDVYDRHLDAFYNPKPYPSWTLNEESCTWIAPKPAPEGDGIYYWDETLGDWVLAS
jgi:hypothetical protein